MLQEKTYSDIKNSLTVDYKFFNKVMGYENIYNSEYKKLNQMFKGLTKKTTYIKRWSYKEEKEIKEPFPANYTSIETNSFYGHYLSNDNLNNLAKDFPNIKKDYDLLKTKKDKVKLGKRPNNECDDYKKQYQEKLYKQAQLEDKAQCGICNKFWEQVDMNGRKNILADHGFHLGWGQRNGVCFGARYLSWERSPESKVAYIEKVLNPILKQLPKEKPTGVDLDKVIQQANNYNNLKAEIHNTPKDIQIKYNDLLSDYRYKSMIAYGKSPRPFSIGDEYITSPEKYIEVKATPEVLKLHELKEKITKPSIKFSGMQVAITLPTNKDDITLELLTRIWSDYKDQVEAEKLKFETAIKNWKLQLTPREKMNKDKA
jgi:DnaJ-domain-containing protein 1